MSTRQFHTIKLTCLACGLKLRYKFAASSTRNISRNWDPCPRCEDVRREQLAYLKKAAEPEPQFAPPDPEPPAAPPAPAFDPPVFES